MSIDKSANYHQRRHAFDITTRAELPNAPVEIGTTAPNSAGTTEFAPGQYEERAALLLDHGQIHTSWTSHCDFSPYSGWIIAYDQDTFTQTSVLNVGPNSGAAVEGGTHFNINGPAIWMSGDGPGADAQGNVYLLTGNGLFEPTLDANGLPNRGDFGNPCVKRASTPSSLTVADYFAMSSEVAESAGDVDLGSGGEMLRPDLSDSSGNTTHLAVGAGKDGNIYVVDRDNMGKVQRFAEPDLEGSRRYRSRPSGRPQEWRTQLAGLVRRDDLLRGFRRNAQAKLSTVPVSQPAATSAYPGASPAVSANGTTNATVWAHEHSDPAVLHAYDASNLAHELYNSNEATGGRDQFGPGNNVIGPAVAGGKVFVGTTDTLALFGLIK